MAVYTQVSRDEAQAFAAVRGLGQVLDLQPIAAGISNSNYALDCSAGRTVLTLFEAATDADALPFVMGLMQHLAACGVPCPAPLADAEGQIVGELAGRKAAIVSWLDGQDPATPDAVACQQAGYWLARLHVAGQAYPHNHPNHMGLDGWRAAVSPHLGDADALQPGLGAEIAGELDWLATHWPAAQALPRGALHADFFADNTLFSGDELTGIIDFYYACTDHLAYDLAIALNAWCGVEDGRLDPARMGAMLTGYQHIRPLTGAERAAMPILLRGAAMRFVASRVRDWFATPDGALVTRKDPLAMLAVLRAHQAGLSPLPESVAG